MTRLVAARFAAFEPTFGCDFRDLPIGHAGQACEDFAQIAKERAYSDMTALHEASRRGDLELVRLLIQKGANVNATAGLGVTPLALAESNAHREVAEQLRLHGAKR